MLLDKNLEEANTGKRINAKGYAVHSKTDKFKPFNFPDILWAIMIYL